ncbi:MAG: quinolinate synthase NadA [Elusimicrobiota bacterium]|jgi:quinolinate synthase|nr:quinolinate synthase NadA [Elusimicrobiota bacterium]
MNDIIDRLNKLKKERNAIIISHIYQLPEIQDIADFVGDSLDLSRKAAQTDADVIMFCGVHFMAETASILNPSKKVLIADPHAGCPMADMITVPQLKELKSQNPSAKVVSYVNTSAAIKAHSDICCTSANASAIVDSLSEGEIIFVPDRNLGAFVSAKTGKKMIIWNGFCPTHNNFILPEHLLKVKQSHPKAQVLVHPECRPETIALADHAMSTGQMCNFISKSGKDEFIIGTELGILHKLKKDNPHKNFYPISELAVCPNMKKTTLSKVLDALLNMKNIVQVPDEIRERAYLPIKKMIDK